MRILISKQGRLKDQSAEVVDSCCRADTFAQYLQDVQWAVMPASLIDESPAKLLSVDPGPITMKELCDAVKAFSSNKAAGPDHQPVEFWKLYFSQMVAVWRGGAGFLTSATNHGSRRECRAHGINSKLPLFTRRGTRRTAAIIGRFAYSMRRTRFSP